MKEAGLALLPKQLHLHPRFAVKRAVRRPGSFPIDGKSQLRDSVGFPPNFADRYRISIC